MNKYEAHLTPVRRSECARKPRSIVSLWTLAILQCLVVSRLLRSSIGATVMTERRHHYQYDLENSLMTGMVYGFGLYGMPGT